MIQGKSIIIFILATFGEGEPPDGATTFLSWLSNNNHEVTELEFAIFGLGDSTYMKFNQCAKNCALMLEKSRMIHPLTLGDDDKK